MSRGWDTPMEMFESGQDEWERQMAERELKSSKTEVAILQASPDYPIKAGRWVDAKDYETLDRSLRESWKSEKRLAAERDRLRAALQQIADEPRQPMGDGRKWAYKLHGIAVTALAGSPVETEASR